MTTRGLPPRAIGRIATLIVPSLHGNVPTAVLERTVSIYGSSATQRARATRAFQCHPLPLKNRRCCRRIRGFFAARSAV